MAALLFVAFIVVPLLEIYLISQVGHLIGLPLTLGVLLMVSVLGAVVVKREGVKAWQAVRQSTAMGRVPTREMADGALVLVGGVLLLTPGFLTDALGFLLVLPLTRPVARRLLTIMALRLLPAGRAVGVARLGGRATRAAWRRRDRGPAGSRRVVDPEVVNASEWRQDSGRE